MVADGRIAAEGFVTIRSGSTEELLRYVNDEEHIVNYFKEYDWAQVREEVRVCVLAVCSARAFAIRLCWCLVHLFVQE